MKQIYDFETANPPAVDEKQLRRELEQRSLRWQTALLALAGLLFQAAVVLLGYSALDWYPWVTAVCFGYAVISTTGCGVIALTYSRKGGMTV